MNVVRELSKVLESRKDAAPDTSYVASLYASGLNKILEKVGEEATEVVLASRDLAQGVPGDSTAPDPAKEPAPQTSPLESALIGEVADLWFHTMVMLTHQNVDPAQVLDELAKRFGVSGIEEKHSR